MSRPVRLRLVGAVALALGLVACGTDDGGTTGGGPTSAGSDRNEADEVYVQFSSDGVGSVLHISGLADDQAESDAVKQLAAEMADELQGVGEEIDGLADDWDLPEVMYGQVKALPAQEPDPEWQRLQDLEGAEFDELWVELAAEGLDAVISSAETVIDEGENVELRELASELLEDAERWAAEVDDLQV